MMSLSECCELIPHEVNVWDKFNEFGLEDKIAHNAGYDSLLTGKLFTHITKQLTQSDEIQM